MRRLRKQKIIMRRKADSAYEGKSILWILTDRKGSCLLYTSLENPRYGSVKEGFDVWREYVESFGFGRKLDSDFLGEGNGYVPVSYTHLDVYKRQDQPEGNGRLGRGARLGDHDGRDRPVFDGCEQTGQIVFR